MKKECVFMVAIKMLRHFKSSLKEGRDGNGS